MRLFQQSKIGPENVGLFTRRFQREGFSGPTKYDISSRAAFLAECLEMRWFRTVKVHREAGGFGATIWKSASKSPVVESLYTLLSQLMIKI